MKRIIMLFFATVASVFMYSSTALASAPITSSTDVDTGGYANALYQINSQPVKDTFERYGWTIDIVSTDTINTLYGLDPELAQTHSLAGFVSPQYKKMYLAGENDYALRAINHEMGHFFDICISPFITTDGVQASHSSDFLMIYIAEAPSCPLGLYASSSPDEYFAEGYKYFLEAPEYLASVAPYTYLYMNAITSRYTKDDVFMTLVNLQFIDFIDV